LTEKLEERAQPRRRIGVEPEASRRSPGGEAIGFGRMLSDQAECLQRLEVTPNGGVAGVTQIPQFARCSAFEVTQTAKYRKAYGISEYRRPARLEGLREGLVHLTPRTLGERPK
jgi:hypothetical protein